jgi:hypothetical protein
MNKLQTSGFLNSTDVAFELIFFADHSLHFVLRCCGLLAQFSRFNAHFTLPFDLFPFSGVETAVYRSMRLTGCEKILDHLVVAKSDCCLLSLNLNFV